MPAVNANFEPVFARRYFVYSDLYRRPAYGTNRPLARPCWSTGSRPRGGTPTGDTSEGFRLLALHRQGAPGQPSFNACRETCRELVYHRNLIAHQPAHPETARRLKMASMVAMHLLLFVSAKMQAAEIGEFCCSSRALRGAAT